MRIIVNSIPKSGTHLVARALELLGASDGKPVAISSATVADLRPVGDEPTIPVGVGMPVLVSARALRQRIESLGAGRIATVHIPHSSVMQTTLSELDVRMVLAIRDPRDVAVSLAFHIAREKSHRLHAMFATMPLEQQILACITGIQTNGQVVLESISQRFACVLPWRNWSGCLTVRFEDLVGPSGGGSREKQVGALLAMCKHLGLEHGPIDSTADRLFGSSATFRKGATGQWRDHFTPAHHLAIDSLLTSADYA